MTDVERLRVFCRKVGATDLHAWLGISPETPHKDAMVHLERRRRDLEASLADPTSARIAELFLDSYDALRDALHPAAQGGATRVQSPDYYAILGISIGAPYSEVESAWRRLTTSHRDDPLITQAWRVLGDPLNRANYDRSRSERARQASIDQPGFESDPMTDSAPLEPLHVELPGPPRREVVLEAEAITTVTVPVVVRGGNGLLRAHLGVDHPAMSTVPESVLEVSPGRHSVLVRFDRGMARRIPFQATLTITGPGLQQAVSFRVRRRAWPSLTSVEPYALAAGALLMLVLGWWLGTRSTITRTPNAPTSIGEISQLPSASACFEQAEGPHPTHVDVHTDGLGRPTGFSFGSVASPEVEACVRNAVERLDFPPTRDGLPAFHRYRVPAVPERSP